MKNGTEILAEHYQKTFELTLNLWEQRNRTFLILLFAVGVGALLTFKVSQAEPLLVDLFANIFRINSEARLNELRANFPYSLINYILLTTVLYLMIQLYHKTISITRNYDYLAGMEEEIREGLDLQRTMISFTREGSFYSKNSTFLTKQIGVAYIVMLGFLLSAFLGKRIYIDIETGIVTIFVVDVILSLVTILFFGAYAYSSSSVIRSIFRKQSKSK
jgi:hypothetical protein